MVANPDLAKRPGMRGLAEYLRARDAVQGVLAERKSHSLTATANQDVALAWATITAGIVERNPAFADLFQLQRKLENDPLQVEPLTMAA